MQHTYSLLRLPVHIASFQLMNLQSRGSNLHRCRGAVQSPMTQQEVAIELDVRSQYVSHIHFVQSRLTLKVAISSPAPNLRLANIPLPMLSPLLFAHIFDLEM